MARAALPGRLTPGAAWRVGELVEVREETASAATLVLRLPGWPGHVAGQHLDLRLTADDGYRAERSYSIASSPGGADPELVELTVQVVEDGEVSPYLARGFEPGSQIEVRGPVGGWFVWRPTQREPVLLVAGGSGLVPLMAMVRTRGDGGDRVPFRLVCSVRTPADLLYAAELRRRALADPGLDVTLVHTREAPEDSARPAGRLEVADLQAAAWPPQLRPTCYVCGPTGFVEAVADTLLALGHDARRIKTERFGPTGAGSRT